MIEDKNFQDIDITPEFKQAIHLLEATNSNIFVTGKAGTGKSTLLQYFRHKTPKNIVVLAPTGVAAVNVKGQTIHSFFHFRPDVTVETAPHCRLNKPKRKLLSQLEAIVIDEISMVRADLLDCIDAFLRKYGPHQGMPFGGVQMIFFGDLYQLPPVVTRDDRELFNGYYKSPYFFDAKSFEHLDLKIIELDKIYRQSEEDFIQLLGQVRNNELNREYLSLLNDRFDPHFESTEDDFYVYLTTTNRKANDINQQQLASLNSKPYRFEGEVYGNYDQKSLPTNELLDLKINAQVMMLNNDMQGRWVNGSLGKVIDVNENDVFIKVELTDGTVVEIEPYTWEMYQFFYNEEEKRVESESIGSFTQFPLKLAWAVTIHKSQGKTFPKVIVDIGLGTFSHGQVYVAISRCTSLKGLILKKPINQRHILLDKRVVEFMSNQPKEQITIEQAAKEKECV